MNEMLHTHIALQDLQVARLPVEVSGDVSAALSGLGRTEDVRFSPDGSRISIAGYRKDTCLIMSVTVQSKDGDFSVALSDAMTISSDAFVEPHGFDFIGNDRLVVANRMGAVAVFRLPPQETGSIRLAPERIIRRIGVSGRVRSPGSVAVRNASFGRVEILVCNNYQHLVSAHQFFPGLRFPGSWGRIALRAQMQVPDGIAISQADRCVAVSSHLTHEVLVYDAARRLRPENEPVARLHGVSYPHGLRFTEDGARLFVADAGAPYIMVYDRPEAGWVGSISPVARFRPIDDDVFLSSRTGPDEGGPKGLDLHPAGNIVAVTNEAQPLAFFSLRN